MGNENISLQDLLQELRMRSLDHVIRLFLIAIINRKGIYIKDLPPHVLEIIDVLKEEINELKWSKWKELDNPEFEESDYCNPDDEDFEDMAQNQYDDPYNDEPEDEPFKDDEYKKEGDDPYQEIIDDLL